ncbi:MAG: glycosyltransferase [Candidatus Dormibacteraeota bacterium]|nr:glycosyltransferase [Candidatus Dormibacteraeota bacterium]
MSPGKDPYDESLHRTGLGLGAGCLLVAAGVAVIVLDLFPLVTRYGVAITLIFAGLILIGNEILRLRKRPDRGQLLWTALLDAILVAAILLAIAPFAALGRGFADLVAQSKIQSGGDWVAYGFAFTGLFLGAVFFAYAVKYYLSTVIVLITTLAFGRGGSNGHNGNGNGNGGQHSGLNRIGNGNGNGYHVDLGYHPFVSVHVAAYNEKRVIERLLTALSQLDYPEYEVIVVDDSTDDSMLILNRWKDRPRFKILHRNSRQGFKGGALSEALNVTDPRTEYVVIFDADSVPFPDSIDRFLPHFYHAAGKNGNGNGNGHSDLHSDSQTEDGGVTKRRESVAAVQSYQWHVLNKSESWLTEAVRAEYAGSYMIERPFQDAVGSLKMVAGTAYMIRADLLREVGWGTSLTEDWELTLKLYARGYKVVYTPWAETPAECVSTFSRLARQRMRWAEGHTHNVRKWFVPIMLSPFVTTLEKVEFLFDTTYYLQAGLFIVGTLAWLMSEIVFHTHVPGWTAALGWALLFSNIFALPLMNLGGLILEEAPARDLQGVLGALVLSFALVPFQGWAAMKGLLSKHEGPWFRTPKTGHITDEVHHLRRLHMLRRWLLGHRARVGEGQRSPGRQPGSPVAHIRARHNKRLGWVVVTVIALTFGGLAWAATAVPVVDAAGNPLYLHGSGVAPCAPSTMDQAIGVRAAPCLVTSTGNPTTGTWTFANLPAQTISAGVWSFTMDWAGGATDTGSVSVSVGTAAAGCAGFVATIPNGGTTWTTTFGAGTPNTTSPLSVNTSASQAALVIAAGRSLCLRVVVTQTNGSQISMLYDGTAGIADTRLIPPSTVVPESLLGLLGLALVIPVVTNRRRLASMLRLVR